MKTSTWMSGLVGPLVVLAMALALTASGCDDDTDTAGTGGSGNTGNTGGVGGAGGDGGAGGESITFIVVSFGVDSEPLEGATVAFDAPGGQREEATTGADGKVTFAGVDWSLGEAAATAFFDGYVMRSVVGLDETTVEQVYQIDDAVVLDMWELAATPAPPSINVSGTGTGFLDGAHDYVVNVVQTAVASEWSGASTGTFSVKAPENEDFILQALELDTPSNLPSGQGYTMPIYQVAHQTVSGSADDLTGVTVDLSANALTTETADSFMATPARTDSPVRDGLSVCLVCPGNSAYCTGWSTHIDIATDQSQFDVSLLWVEPTWAEDVITLCRVYESSSSSRVISYQTRQGYPQAGSLGTLPDTPEWVTPTSTTTPHPLHEAIEWELFDDMPVVGLSLVRNGATVWEILTPPNATSLTVPAVPSVVDETELLGTMFVDGSLIAGDWSWTAARWASFARPEPLLLQP